MFGLSKWELRDFPFSEYGLERTFEWLKFVDMDDATRLIIVRYYARLVMGLLAEEEGRNDADDRLQEIVPSLGQCKMEPEILCEAFQKKAFAKVNAIAVKNEWWEKGSLRQCRAAIKYALRSLCSKSGDTCVATSSLRRRCRSYGVDIQADRLSPEYGVRLICSDMVVSSTLQDGLVEMVKMMRCGELSPLGNSGNLGLTLHQKQREAIEMIRRFRVSAIVGAGGTGKTRIIETLVEKFSGIRPIILSPTHAVLNRIRKSLQGRVKVISTWIGQTPGNVPRVMLSTIARFVLLGSKELGSSNRPTIILVDESSMIGTENFNTLCKIVRHRLLDRCRSKFDCRICFIGDPHQLPPVTPGQPLIDLVGRGCIKALELTRNYRLHKHVGKFCTKIRHTGTWDLGAEQDIRFLESNDEKQVLANTRTLLTDLFQKGYRMWYDGNKPSIRIITPTNNMASRLIQEIRSLLPPGRKIQNGAMYAVGDVVLMRKNEAKYKNGDLGTVCRVEALKKKGLFKYHVQLRKSGSVKVFDSALRPAAVTTIHNAQGAEADVVIAVAFNRNKGVSGWNTGWRHAMLNRQLSYTTASRARKALLYVGPKDCFDGHLARRLLPRETLLGHMLRKEWEKKPSVLLGTVVAACQRKSVPIDIIRVIGNMLF